MGTGRIGSPKGGEPRSRPPSQNHRQARHGLGPVRYAAILYIYLIQRPGDLAMVIFRAGAHESFNRFSRGDVLRA